MCLCRNLFQSPAGCTVHSPGYTDVGLSFTSVAPGYPPSIALISTSALTSVTWLVIRVPGTCPLQQLPGIQLFISFFYESILTNHEIRDLIGENSHFDFSLWVIKTTASSEHKMQISNPKSLLLSRYRGYYMCVIPEFRHSCRKHSMSWTRI